MKRLFDVLAAIILLMLLSPIYVLVSMAILFILGRPIFFIQKRPGLRAVPFQLIKFRTMLASCDRYGNPLPDEQRLTSFGKLLRSTSLDELPELLNVLTGDMSLVGPRPLLMEYLELYDPDQARRHEARPGITGWAQVNGRNALSWEDKFRLDVWYVDNYSFLLDMKILWLTVGKVLKRDGISLEGRATTEKFCGSKPGVSRR